MTFPFSVMGMPASALVAPLTLRTSNTSATHQVTAPPGIEAGDIIYLVDYQNRGGSGVPFPGANTQPGFTLLSGSSSLIEIGGWCQMKVADGTESGTVYTMVNPPSTNYTQCLVFAASAVAFLSTMAVGASFFDVGDKTISSSAGIAPTVALASYPPGYTSTWTPTEDAVVATAGTDLATFYKIFNTSPQDISEDNNLNNTVMQYGYFYPIRSLPTKVAYSPNFTPSNLTNLVDGSSATLTTWGSPGALAGLTVAQRVLCYVDLGVTQTIKQIKGFNVATTTSSGAFGFYYSTDAVTWTAAGSGDSVHTATTTQTDFTTTPSTGRNARYVAIVLNDVDWTGIGLVVGELSIKTTL